MRREPKDRLRFMHCYFEIEPGTVLWEEVGSLYPMIPINITDAGYDLRVFCGLFTVAFVKSKDCRSEFYILKQLELSLA